MRGGRSHQPLHRGARRLPKNPQAPLGASRYLAGWLRDEGHRRCHAGAPGAGAGGGTVTLCGGNRGPRGSGTKPRLCWTRPGLARRICPVHLSESISRETMKPKASMGADQSFALPFYEKLATHYAHSRQSDAECQAIWLVQCTLFADGAKHELLSMSVSVDCRSQS